MKPLVAVLVAAAVLVAGALPALALVLDSDSGSDADGHSHWSEVQEDHGHAPGWAQEVPPPPGWGGRGVPPGVARCLGKVWKHLDKLSEEQGGPSARPGQPDEGVPGDLHGSPRSNKPLLKACRWVHPPQD